MFIFILFFFLKAFDLAEKELGISPVMTGKDMAECEVPDKLTMVSYLSQFYVAFKKEKHPKCKHHKKYIYKNVFKLIFIQLKVI